MKVITDQFDHENSIQLQAQRFGKKVVFLGFFGILVKYLQLVTFDKNFKLLERKQEKNLYLFRRNGIPPCSVEVLLEC